MKRKIIAIFVLLGCLFVFSSCDHIYKYDFDKFKESGYADSSLGITRHEYLFPSSTFLDDYDYIDGQYYYKCDSVHIMEWVEASFIYLSYENNVYLEAKEFALENLDLSTTNIYTHNGYEFAEILSLPKHYRKYKDGVNTAFPHHFIMFCYNDEKNCLIFLGFAGPSGSTKIPADLLTDPVDWGSFLNTYYSEYYDFDS